MCPFTKLRCKYAYFFGRCIDLLFFYLMKLRVLDFRFFQDSNYMLCKQFDNDRLERINEPELISRLKSSTMNCRRFFSKGKFLFRKCKGSSLEMPGESSMNVQRERV